MKNNTMKTEMLMKDCDDIIEILGCEGIKPKSLLEPKMTTLMTRIELFVPKTQWK
jgi:hypothetical protein